MPRVFRAMLLVGLLATAPGGASALAASTRIAGTPAGRVETGTPQFVVVRPEGIGLTSSPTDIHILPDGRVLIVSAQEFAIGDGVRWETYQRDPDEKPVNLENVAVDSDGTIYAATPNGFSSIRFVESGRWRFQPAATLPDVPTLANRTLLRTANANDAWFWHTGSGPVVSWRPGTIPRQVGTINDLERVFSAGGRTFFSDASNGALRVLAGDRFETFPEPAAPSLDQAVTSAIPLPDGRTLLGTNSVGARILAGERILPFQVRGPLDGRHRINDLCLLEGGLFAAALDHLGVAIFDMEGRQIEVIDRTIHHQLARTRRLVPGPGGTLWALLVDGIACIQFPSQVSSFDALVSTGITFSLLYRHHGDLWIVSDGRAQRAIYDGDGRLLRFEIDGPGAYISSLCTAFDRLIACGTQGIYVREGGSWRLAIPGIVSALVSPDAEPDGGHVYAARNEIGILRMTPDGPSVERVPAPQLGDPYVGVTKAGDDYWLELGSGRAGRVRIEDGRPVATVYGLEHGLRDSWAQLFVIDGIARFNLAGRVMRLDEASQRFITDDSLTALCGGPIGGHGRPARDAAGRLWFPWNDSVRVVGTSPTEPEPHLPNAIAPILFTMQDDGVVWMHQRQKLLRYDPSLPAAAPAPFRAMVSRVQLVGSNRYLFGVEGRLPALDFQDNTIAFHFLAPGAVFGGAVTFEVLLNGGGDTWMSTGASGFASFSRLKEGSYVLHVRPRSGPLVGAEDTVAFVIRPPWYRTTVAYWSYGIGGVAAVALIVWFWSMLARREKIRLESLVASRTVELRGSEERYRRLNEELEQRVETRTHELHLSNQRLNETNRELEAFSYSVSHDLRAPLRGIDGWSHALLEDYAQVLDGTAKAYIGRVRSEAQRLGHLIDDLLTLSRTTRADFRPVPVDLSALVATIARRIADSRPEFPVEFTCEPGLQVHGDPVLLETALTNLLDNAWKFTGRTASPRVEFGRIESGRGAVFFVRDNGAGFDMRHARKLFGVFQRMHAQEEFPGTGVGLATVQRIVQRHGGDIWAEAAPGFGATFFFTLPGVSATPGHGESMPAPGEASSE